MTRLTKKGVTPVDAIQTSADIANMYHVYNKLSKLEDIEEELGVDLIKLLNAKKVYVLDYGKPYETWSPSINFKTRKIYTIDEITRTICGQYDIKDYGKTWAFTREELEK